MNFRCILLLFLGVLFLVPVESWAQSKKKSWRKNRKNTSAPYHFVGPRMPQGPERPLTMDQEYYRALKLLLNEELGKASSVLEEVKQRSIDEGYQNLPSYSVELIRRAKLYREQGKVYETRFLVKQAALLSPTDSRIAFLASAFKNELGRKEALSYFWTALKNLPSYPVLVSSLLLNVLLFGLVAGTLSLLVVCIVQVIAHGEQVYGSSIAVLPKGIRGLFGPLWFLTIMIGPLFAGVLCALAVWTCLLAFSLKHCRWFGLMGALTILFWGVSLNVMRTAQSNIELPMNTVLEDVANQGYSPNTEEWLLSALTKSPKVPELKFAYGQLLIQKGEYTKAQGVFKELLKTTPNSSQLTPMIQNNLAVSAYRLGDMDSAKELLLAAEDAIGNSFEVNYNLSLTYLALLDTESHRKYFLKISEIDPIRALSEDDVEAGTKNTLLLPLPAAVIYPRMSDIALSQDGDIDQGLMAKQIALAESLLLNGTSMHILILGMGALLLAYIGSNRLKRKAQVDWRAQMVLSERSKSYIWMFLPGGINIAGVRPGRGVWVCGLFLMFLMAALEAPIKPFKVLPVHMQFSSPLLFGAASVLLISSASAFLFASSSGGSRKSSKSRAGGV